MDRNPDSGIIVGAFSPEDLENLLGMHDGVTGILISYEVVMDIIANPEFAPHFDPENKPVNLNRGHLGRLMKVDIFTDAYLDMDKRLLKSELVLIKDPRAHDLETYLDAVRQKTNVVHYQCRPASN